MYTSPSTCSPNSCSTGPCGPKDCGMSCESSCPTSGMAHTPEAMTYQLLMSAMKAKKSLMHDKLKAKLDTKIGDKLDQAAEATVDTFIAIWQDKSSTMEHKAKLTEKLATMMQDK